MKVDAAVHAFFLKSRPSGDTSLHTTFFTREYGILQALYKGGRTPKKQIALQPFTPLWLVFNVHHDWYYVRHVECERPTSIFPGKILFAALYINEILDAMLKPEDASPELYAAYTQAISRLEQADSHFAVEPLLRRFERILLNVAGYALPLTHDAYSNEPIDAGQYYQWIAGSGFVASNVGYWGEHILAFANDKLDDIDTLRTVKQFMRQVMAYAMDGKMLQTRKLYTRDGPIG